MNGVGLLVLVLVAVWVAREWCRPLPVASRHPRDVWAQLRPLDAEGEVERVFHRPYDWSEEAS